MDLAEPITSPLVVCSKKKTLLSWLACSAASFAVKHRRLLSVVSLFCWPAGRLIRDTKCTTKSLALIYLTVHSSSKSLCAAEAIDAQGQRPDKPRVESVAPKHAGTGR